ncbi:hypothetical protein B0J15DRAFT_465085 [Fusarium solani]|uniref:Uncharacterized protein n=1 Tax=Fusarium solani TaxID=169388 RepID=A0A9P9HPD3_FUSSL|nr:uncharacterized protein B0J15DRAFT_465085 [Fusarium solani]KAH7260362.1 hypothetical protein B0J15DRAFT_465085 [Fusarium solani]
MRATTAGAQQELVRSGEPLDPFYPPDINQQSIPELVALALNSEPPKRVCEMELQNISAGIETFGQRQKMGWVESIDDNAVTTGAQTNPIAREEQLQLRSGISAPMTQGKAFGVSRVNTRQLYR